MEKPLIPNYPQQATTNEAEIVIKEEIFDDYPMKCGEVFLLQTNRIVLICGFCKVSYGDMNEFGVHVQENHIAKNQIIEHLQIEKIEAVEMNDWQDDENFVPYDEESEKDEMDASEEKLEKRAKRRKRRVPYKTKAERTEMKDPTLYCTICKTQYENKAKFRLHREVKHNILRPCEFCNKPFDSIEERSEHEKTHVGDCPYPCPQCSAMFKRRYGRDHHVQNIHEGVKPFKCSVCDRSFATRTLLQAHLVVHSLPGQHSCEICGRQFAHESRKKMHMRMHTGEKSYQCDECGNRYMNQALLTYHKKQHAGVKDVECKICGKMYYTRRQLTHHARIHTAVKRHACPICGDCFKRSCALKQHMKLHSDVKEYSCNICGKEFAQIAGLYSHRKSHLKDIAE